MFGKRVYFIMMRAFADSLKFPTRTATPCYAYYHRLHFFVTVINRIAYEFTTGASVFDIDFKTGNRAEI